MTDRPEAEYPELRARLAALPPLRPPPDVTRRWSERLAELPPPHAPGRGSRGSGSPGFGSRRPPVRRALSRPRAAGLGAGLLVAAATVAALVWLPVAAPDAPPGAPPISVSRGELPAVALAASTPADGPLADPARLAACLTRTGGTGATVLGTRRVLLDGRPGVLLVLPTETPGRLRALVVTPDCGPDAGVALADTLVGR